MNQLINNIKEFFITSYTSDRKAFYAELLGTLSAVIASGWLSIMADDPPLIWIYPFYLISSLFTAYAGVRRNAAWIALLSVYFTFINIYGILNLTVF